VLAHPPRPVPLAPASSINAATPLCLHRVCACVYMKKVRFVTFEESSKVLLQRQHDQNTAAHAAANTAASSLSALSPFSSSSSSSASPLPALPPALPPAPAMETQLRPAFGFLAGMAAGAVESSLILTPMHALQVSRREAKQEGG